LKVHGADYCTEGRGLTHQWVFKRFKR